MNTSIAKIIKGKISVVQEHLRAVERAREIYLAGIKRLEAEYFERIKNAGDALLDDNSQVETQHTAEASASSEQPAAQ